MTNEWRLQERLDHILETSCIPEETCAEYPDLLPNVRKRLKQVRHVENQLDLLFPSSYPATEKERTHKFSASENLLSALPTKPESTLCIYGSPKQTPI